MLGRNVRSDADEPGLPDQLCRGFNRSLYLLHASVMYTCDGGGGQIKEVAPGWSVVVHHNRWKV